MNFQDAEFNVEPLWLSLVSRCSGYAMLKAFLKTGFFFELYSIDFDKIGTPEILVRMQGPVPGKFPFFRSALNREQNSVKRP